MCTPLLYNIYQGVVMAQMFFLPYILDVDIVFTQYIKLFS